MFSPALATTLQAGSDEQIDLLTVTESGALSVIWIPRPFTPGGHLGHGPAEVTPAGTFPPGAPVAVAPQVNDVTTAVAVDNGGCLSVSWVINGEAWQGPARISPPVFPAGAPVAMARQGPDQLDVFAVDTNGALTVSWVVGGGQWQGPVAITPPIFPPGAHVAAAPQVADVLVVFAVDREGFLTFSWVVGGGQWQGPLRHGPGIFPAGAPVTLARQGPGQLDVFAVDNSGVQHVAWVVGTGAWQGPVGITPAIYPPGAHVAVAQQTGDVLTTMAVDRQGALHLTWVVGGGNWQGPLRHGDAVFAPGAPLSLVKQDTWLHVFAFARVVWRSMVRGIGEWTPPQPLPFRQPEPPPPPPPPPPPALVPPVISVAYDAGSRSFRVTGSGFLGGRTVHVRVVNHADVQNQVFFTTTADGAGAIDFPISFAIAVPQTYGFSANDGRSNPRDLTGTLWSNTVNLTAT